MGILESQEYNLHCQHCLTDERIKIHQYGSSYGASWKTKNETDKFKINWSNEKEFVPTIKKLLA